MSYHLKCVGPGWRPLVESLIKCCEAEGAAILQVKEKFGGLRFYAIGISDALCEAIAAAERLSYQICEECGAPGIARGGGWIKTLCEYHAQGRKPLETLK